MCTSHPSRFLLPLSSSLSRRNPDLEQVIVKHPSCGERKRISTRHHDSSSPLRFLITTKQDFKALKLPSPFHGRAFLSPQGPHSRKAKAFFFRPPAAFPFSFLSHQKKERQFVSERAKQTLRINCVVQVLLNALREIGERSFRPLENRESSPRTPVKAQARTLVRLAYCRTEELPEMRRLTWREG